MKSIGESMIEMTEIIYKLRMERTRYLMALKTINNLIKAKAFDEIKGVVDVALQDKKDD